MSIFPQARAGLVMVVLALLALSALAHHGWDWTSDELIEVEGEIEETRWRNPHAEIIVRAAGEPWLVELGQVWRNRRAGLSAEMLARGRTLRVQGQPSAKEGVHHLKAVRLIIDGRNYDLYPDRLR